jgi:hypothetical protein
MNIKLNKAIKNYTGFKGDRTINSVIKQIPDELLKQLTSKQLALVMQVINTAYQNGRASTGAEKIDTDCIWVSGIEKLIEIVEVGAKYESVTEPRKFDPVTNECISTERTYSKKVQAGELICRFVK